jgi:hypothetical protein
MVWKNLSSAISRVNLMAIRQLRESDVGDYIQALNYQRQGREIDFVVIGREFTARHGRESPPLHRVIESKHGAKPVPLASSGLLRELCLNLHKAMLSCSDLHSWSKQSVVDTRLLSHNYITTENDRS